MDEFNTSKEAKQARKMYFLVDALNVYLLIWLLLLFQNWVVSSYLEIALTRKMLSKNALKIKFGCFPKKMYLKELT